MNCKASILAACFACATIANAAAADTEPLPAEERDLCNAQIGGLQSELNSAKRWSSLLVFAGAVLAAAGSGAAGILAKPTARKISAAIGVIGAAAGAGQKLLPEPTEIQERLILAEGHRLPAEKVFRQLPYLNDEEYRKDCLTYASARFVECASANPKKEVPAIPQPQIAQAGVPEGRDDAEVRGVAMTPAPDPVAVEGRRQRVVAAARSPVTPVAKAPASPHRPEKVIGATLNTVLDIE